MKTKRHNDRRGRVLPALLALALAAGLVLAAPPVGGMALAADTPLEDTGAIPAGSSPQTPQGGGPAAAGGEAAGPAPDLAGECSLSLKFPDAEAMGGVSQAEHEALLASRPVFDLYKIADAVPAAGYGAYEFGIPVDGPYYTPVSRFIGEHAASWRARQADGMLLFCYAPNEKSPVSDWASLAVLLARQCFDEGQAPTVPSVPVGGTAERLAPGLYLTVVHGQNIPSLAGSRYPGYLIREEIKEDEALDPSAAYRSIACTDTKIYIFQPQLIGLPSVDGLDTAGSGGWQYAVEAVTKSEIKKRYADLEITKTLSSYSDPVTFVFEVEAVPPDIDSLTPAEKANYEAGLYKWVVPIRFEGAGGQTVSIRGEIPAGWRVTVTEVYSGMAYRNTGAQPGIRPNGPGPAAGLTDADVRVEGSTIAFTAIPGGSIAIIAPDGQEVELEGGSTVTAAFVNEHNGSNLGGGSVVNGFEQDANGGWTWAKRVYDPQAKEWVETKTGTGLPVVTVPDPARLLAPPTD